MIGWRVNWGIDVNSRACLDVFWYANEHWVGLAEGAD
jgi:hypothetical protein